jgi:hypothetical protein
MHAYANKAFFSLKRFAPVEVENYFSTHILKTNTAMDNFVGRRKKN